jgi:uncharacterized OsmC-like protein
VSEREVNGQSHAEDECVSIEMIPVAGLVADKSNDLMRNCVLEGWDQTGSSFVSKCGPAWPYPLRKSSLNHCPPKRVKANVAPNPMEYALGALISCQVVTYRLYAHMLGIQVDAIGIGAEGDLDIRGFFGLDESVRPGFTNIRLIATITGPETEERYRELATAVEAHCPVYDLFSNPTTIAVSVRKT